MTQTVTVLSTTPGAGYYWAEQFHMQAPSNQGTGYMGLQSAGIRRLDGTVGDTAIYSIWDAVDARGPACGVFFEATPGYSCSIAYDWQQQVPYQYHLAKGPAEADGTWWTASVKDMTTGVTTLIGEIKVPASWGGLDGSLNFTEYFRWRPAQDCSEIPYSRVRFGIPTANNGTVKPTNWVSDISLIAISCHSSVVDDAEGAIHDLGNAELASPDPTTTTSTSTTSTTSTSKASPTTQPADPPTTVAPTGGPAPNGRGYWLAAADGGIFNFGDAPFLGSTGDVRLQSPIVAMAPTPSGDGYWLVAADGGVFAFGDARFLGSTGGISLNSPIVGMAAAPRGDGYWLVAADGGLFNFGPGARFFGSTGAMRLNSPIVGMAAAPRGDGYWLVAADGGLFNFGPGARFFGSTGAITLAQPIVGMAITPAGSGYWVVASDGGIFAFGDAGFFGSTGAVRLAQPIVDMATTPTGLGYWLVASDGGIFAFGDARFYGSTGDVKLNQPIADLAPA